MRSKIQVTYYHRRPVATNFSVERLFRDVRAELPPNFQPRVVMSRFTSRGLFRRIWNLAEAPRFQGDVNHITGDVHYLTYLLHKERTILTILDSGNLNQMRGLRKTLFFFFWYWLPAQRCHLISVISEATHRELVRHLPSAIHKIRVVHCPVSNSFLTSPRPFNVSRPVLLQVGTGKHKNLCRVAQALAGITCHLRIVGRLAPEQIRSLEDNNIEYSNVASVSDAQIIQEYRNADLLVFASTYEGFGLPILEAQATGRPVVTSNLLSMPEVSGDGACLVDPYDIESIRSGILQVIQDEDHRARLIERGYANVERFRPQVIADKYVELYREILGGKS